MSDGSGNTFPNFFDDIIVVDKTNGLQHKHFKNYEATDSIGIQINIGDAATVNITKLQLQGVSTFYIASVAETFKTPTIICPDAITKIFKIVANFNLSEFTPVLEIGTNSINLDSYSANSCIAFTDPLDLDYGAGANIPANDITFEDSNAETYFKNARLALANANIARNKPIQRIAFEGDSEVEGTPKSFVDIAAANLGAKQSNTAFWVRAFTPFYSNIAEVTDVSTIPSRATFPRNYSFDGYGLMATNAVAGSWKQLPQNSAGPVNWEFCYLYYLIQPGGGTFNFNQWDATTPGPITAVNTAGGAYDLGIVVLPKSLLCPSAYVQATSIVGNVVFYGILYCQGGPTTDVYSIKKSQQGSTAIDWAKLDAGFQTKWYNALNFDVRVLRLGKNDWQGNNAAATFQTALNTCAAFAANATTVPALLLVEPTQSFNISAALKLSYPPVYPAVAKANGAGYLDMQMQLGNYATIFNFPGMNVDGIHDGAATIQGEAYLLAMLLGCVHPNVTAYPYTFGQHTPNETFPNFRGLKQLSVGQNNPVAPTQFNTQVYFSNNIGAQSLAVAVAVGDTTFSMNSVSGYNPLGDILCIDSEMCYFTGIDTVNKLLTGVVRGAFNTAAAIHNIGGAVSIPQVVCATSLTSTPTLMILNGKTLVNRSVASAGNGLQSLQFLAAGIGTAGAVCYGIGGSTNDTGLYSKVAAQDVSIAAGANDIITLAKTNKALKTWGSMVDGALDKQAFTNAGTFNGNIAARKTINTTTATIAAATFNLPTGVDGQEYELISDGIITALTVTSTGNTVLNPPTAAVAGGRYKFLFTAPSTWH